jgi:ABC-type sugar transport system ATPase subunit
MALLTEDRKETGLNLKGTVQENLTLAGIARLARFGLIDNRRESQVADQTLLDMKIKAGSRHTPVAVLSGGNQQKVVLSKWLYTDPEIILLDEPTRGIDVASKMDIYLMMGVLVKAGKALILISSELPELMELSDRILVLSGGKLTGEMPRSRFSPEAILRYASSSCGDHT